MINLENKINEISNSGSDIHEHIKTLIRYGSECQHITEMGVRWIVSTWAFVYSSPKKLISYDIEDPSFWGANINDVYDICKNKNIDYSFIKTDVRKIEIEETELLFIDTLHTYDQLSCELSLHGNKSNKYIIFHDTTTFAHELWPAIEQFVSKNSNVWRIHEKYENNNGLTILKRI